MVQSLDWHPLLLSAELAVCSTLLLLPPVTLLAWWLSGAGTLKILIRSLCTLPMVLPPTVVGFYLLSILSPRHGIGNFLDAFLGIRLVFSFPGMVLATCIISIPFLLNPLLSGFESLPGTLTDAARILGKSRFTILTRILLPNMIPSILTGTVLSFAHAMGEFGVLLMVGGKIPGKTLVASMAIYDYVETMQYANALQYSLILSGSTFMVFASLSLLQHRTRSAL
jgi:molybdate transport system permease protein